jgi:hypothetical protein
LQYLPVLCPGEGGLDIAEESVKVGASQLQRSDANEGHQTENQTVFGKALTAVIRKNFLKHDLPFLKDK